MKARKPRFNVGDVVKWEDPHSGPMAGFVEKWWAAGDTYEYRLHGYRSTFREADIKLVKRAVRAV